MDESEFRARLAATNFVVKGSGDEARLLWEKFCVESIHRTPLNKYRWRNENPGLTLTIGRLGDMPVCIGLFWHRIEDVLVLFVEDSSQVVDHRMIDEWIEKNCSPRWCGGTRSAVTNAANFHHVLDYVEHPRSR